MENLHPLFKKALEPFAPPPASRVGCFSSSSIWKLTIEGKREMTPEELANRPKKGVGSKTTLVIGGFGEKALTYIAEKRMEKRLGLPLEGEVSTWATSWGCLVEKYAFDKLEDLDYQLRSKVRYAHPTIECWNGSPDLIHPDKVSDLKCPFTRKAFCELVDSMISVEAFKEHSPEYYFQLVSNAILTNRKRAEIIVFMPYLEQLAEIRNLKNTQPEHWEACKVDWMDYAEDDRLPYLIEGNHYKNMNSFVFDIPQADIDFLTSKVMEAAKLLNA